MIPTLKPVGHQSTNVTDFLFLISAMVALTSLGATYNFFYSKNARENVTENTAYISTIQQTDGHVFACARVTLDHLVFGLKAVLCYFCYANLFVVCLRNNRDGDVNAHCIPSLPSKNATYTLSAEMIGL